MLLWRSAHFSGIGSATCPDASRRFVHRSGTGRIKSLVKLITSILILPSRANPIIGNIFPKSNSFLPGEPVEQDLEEGGETDDGFARGHYGNVRYRLVDSMGSVCIAGQIHV